MTHKSTLDIDGNYIHCDDESCSYCNKEYLQP